MKKHPVTTEIWIPGLPATFATVGENRWKEALVAALGQVQWPGEGLDLTFVLPTLFPRGQGVDLDNLCEPVFSVLTTRLGWFGGKKRNIQWWRAAKRQGAESGLRLRSGPGPNVLPGEPERKLFEGAFAGPLPRRATEPQLPLWLQSQLPPGLSAGGYALHLHFGQVVNIADIATGRVKAVIDCLYPLIGGSAGSPEDWRVGVVQVDRGEDVGKRAVKIAVWEGAEIPD